MPVPVTSQNCSLPLNTSMGQRLHVLDTQIHKHPFIAGLNPLEVRKKLDPYLAGLEKQKDQEGFNKFLVDIFPLIHENLSVNNSGLGKIILEVSDIQYLIANPIGHIIRRPFLAEHFTEFAKEQIHVETKELEEVRDIILDGLKKYGYSKFIEEDILKEITSKYPDRKIYINATECLDEFRLKAEKLGEAAWHYCALLADKGLEYSSCYTNKDGGIFNSFFDKFDTGEKIVFRCYAEPGHVFNISENITLFRFDSIIRVAEELKKKELLLPQTIMILEDNPFFAQSLTVYRACKGLTAFKVNEEITGDPEIPSKRYENMGIYSSGERALEVIHEKLKQNEMPNILLCDIELGSGMNGLQFIRTVTELAKKAGKEIKIVFVTSSNISFYESEIAKLEEENLVQGSFRKSDFSLLKLVDAINKELSN